MKVWVFAGSGFWKDDETGQEHYKANAGDLICVSNFPTATLDLPVKSTDSNDDLQFVPFTEHVPAQFTEQLFTRNGIEVVDLDLPLELLPEDNHPNQVWTRKLADAVTLALRRELASR